MKAKGQLHKRIYRPGHHGTLIGVIGKVPNLIYVNQNDELEMQVKSVVHELAHIGLELEEFLYGSMVIPKNIKDIETKVEKLTDEFYDRNPPLLQKIRGMLSVLPNSEIKFWTISR